MGNQINSTAEVNSSEVTRPKLYANIRQNYETSNQNLSLARHGQFRRTPNLVVFQSDMRLVGIWYEGWWSFVVRLRGARDRKPLGAIVGAAEFVGLILCEFMKLTSFSENWKLNVASSGIRTRNRYFLDHLKTTEFCIEIVWDFT